MLNDTRGRLEWKSLFTASGVNMVVLEALLFRQHLQAGSAKPYPYLRRATSSQAATTMIMTMAMMPPMSHQLISVGVGAGGAGAGTGAGGAGGAGTGAAGAGGAGVGAGTGAGGGAGAGGAGTGAGGAGASVIVSVPDNPLTLIS